MRHTLRHSFGLFLSTPSGWRATAKFPTCSPRSTSYFYPRPPGGGRRVQALENGQILLFLSTPSGWRATATGYRRYWDIPISIHALRVEGDAAPKSTLIYAQHFYPRPPGGGRRTPLQACSQLPVFLSTPSGWRATRRRNNIILDGSKFLSTPSGWRATARSLYHAARRVGFLSTPSGWRATTQLYGQGRKQAISIHALRVEGDYAGGAQWAVPDDFYPRPPGGGRRGTDKAKARLVKISIHALRVEGDALHLPGIFKEVYFYPRPPGGGRPWKRYRRTSWKPYFYPRPPGGGRLLTMRSKKSFKYFYPRPPGGGRQARGRCKTDTNDFYPRPPGGGRHSGGGFARNRRVFLSTPSGWRATCAAIAMIRASHAISIHALRVEGDACTINAKCPGDDISIHALRVEGDPETARQGRPRNYFYPRPPGGGRHRAAKSLPLSARFLSTPSGWRATSSRHATIRTRTISIHALRVEGDSSRFNK